MARTKSVRIKAKRGRPRKEGEREPNGRPSRSGIAHEPADRVAIEARMRRLGLNAEDAKNQKAASFIGLLNMRGADDGLSDHQYDAAVAFQELHQAMQRSIQSPGAIYDPQAIGGAGSDPDAYEKWFKSVNQQYTDAGKAIMEAQFENKAENLLAAVDFVLIRNEPWEHMVGATRIVCNVLARHFKIVEGSRKAA